MTYNIFKSRLGTKLNITIITLLITFTLCSCTFFRPQPPAPIKPAKIAVVLGGGGAKGFAHIGVLKVLEGNNIPVHMIVGTSMGSLIGSLYASGKSAAEVQNISMEFEVPNWDGFKAYTGFGTLSGEKVEKFINEKVKNTPIQKLKIPFYAVATAIDTGEEVTFARGDTGKAVLASCAMPEYFKPVEIGLHSYVDGYVLNLVPVNIARRYGADVIIAVDVSNEINADVPEGKDAINKKIEDIMIAKHTANQLINADIIIHPNMSNVKSSDFGGKRKRTEAILEGEKAAKMMMPKIQNLMDRLKKEGRI